MKTCFKCLRSLDIDQFYRHPRMKDGHLGKCKECAKLDVAKNRIDKLDQYKKYDYERTRTDSRREANRKASNKRRRIHSSKISEATSRYRADHPERYRAHAMVNQAVRSGKIEKMPCQICGNAKVHAHHQDYSKPLDVAWLCSVHHAEIHSLQDNKKEKHN